MKKRLLLLLLILFVGAYAWAQKGSKASSGAASSPSGNAPSTPATSSNQQSGYVYRLPWRYHVRYDSTYTKTDSSKTANPSKGTIVYLHKRKIYTDELKGVDEPTTSIHQEHGTKRSNEKPRDTVILTTTPAHPPADVTGYTIVNTFDDPVSRYWDKPRDAFTRHRLRVSVTQADSGKLQLGIFYVDVPDLGFPIDTSLLDYTKLVKGKKKTPDWAVPITQKDSAQNFYLQIDNKIHIIDPISFISLPYALTQYGAMTVPFRHRFAPKKTQIYVKQTQGPRYAADTLIAAPSESTASINLSIYLGRKWGRTRFYFDPTKTHNTLSFMLAGFVGASLVPIGVSTVKYPKDADSLASQALAFTAGGAATIEWRMIDFGFFSGIDFVSNKYSWIYNHKIWIGFGIGVNLGMFTSGPNQIQL